MIPRLLAAALFLTLAACHSAPQAATKADNPKTDTSWRDTFNVNKADLSASGANPYFHLRPGTVSIFRDGDTVLIISALKQTRTVDGVETRVVEEREMAAGKPKEISRNFFAIDSKTGDVFYFGEETDEYHNGKVTHPGVWLAGQNGARFGLMMPAHPKVGDRYYQELAPGVAMDRFEVLATDETVTVPAGTFKRCIHIRETSPLESGSSDKWYAPEVGLIKDGDAVLTSHKSP